MEYSFFGAVCQRGFFRPPVDSFAGLGTFDGSSYQAGCWLSRRTGRSLQWPSEGLATVRLSDGLTYKTAEWLLLQVAHQQAVYVVRLEA